MTFLMILLVLFLCLAAFVDKMPSGLRTMLWVGAAICGILLILQAIGVALPWHPSLR